MWDPYAEFECEKLPNGLTVYAAHWPKRPWEAVGFVIHSGAKEDPVGFEGTAHFVEHLVSRNAPISEEEIVSFFENCGGMLGLSSTTYFATCYRFFAPANKEVLAKAFSLFGQMLLLARLERFIEEEREIIIKEFYQHYPAKHFFEIEKRKYKMLYSGTWLERFPGPGGTPSSIERITRKELQSFYDAHYTPPNITVVAIGGLKLEEIVDLLLQSPFKINKEGRRTQLPGPIMEFSPPLENFYLLRPLKYFLRPPRIVVYLNVARIPGNISNQIVEIMGAMLSQILAQEVREKRAWSYQIEVSINHLVQFYEFRIECPLLASKAVAEIEKVIEDCILSIAERNDLFEKIKHRFLGEISLIDINGKALLDRVLENLTFYQRIITIEETKRDIAKATMKDLQKALKCLESRQRWTCIFVP